MVLSTALFGKPAFKNLICNGLVLAEDGKKMSKRLKNYPLPMDVIDEYGAVSVCITITKYLKNYIARGYNLLITILYFSSDFKLMYCFSRTH